MPSENTLWEQYKQYVLTIIEHANHKEPVSALPSSVATAQNTDNADAVVEALKKLHPNDDWPSADLKVMAAAANLVLMKQENLVTFMSTRLEDIERAGGDTVEEELEERHADATEHFDWAHDILLEPDGTVRREQAAEYSNFFRVE